MGFFCLAIGVVVAEIGLIYGEKLSKSNETSPSVLALLSARSFSGLAARPRRASSCGTSISLITSLHLARQHVQVWRNQKPANPKPANWGNSPAQRFCVTPPHCCVASRLVTLTGACRAGESFSAPFLRVHVREMHGGAKRMFAALAPRSDATCACSCCVLARRR